MFFIKILTISIFESLILSFRKVVWSMIVCGGGIFVHGIEVFLCTKKVFYYDAGTANYSINRMDFDMKSFLYCGKEAVIV